MAALNRRYTDATQAAERTATIQALRSRYGAERVHYRRCDVRDPAQVSTVIAEITDIEGHIDVVVHGAGLVRSATLARKPLADYRLVRDVKVRGEMNLRAALEGSSLSLWCSLSSVGSFIGMRGEADYQAGNEFLVLSAAAGRSRGRDEVAIVSGLWVESGMAAGYSTGSPFTSGLADFTQLTDRQGTELFRAELTERTNLGTGLAGTWLGHAEWATLHRQAPGLRERAAQEPVRTSCLFLTADPDHVGDQALWQIQIDLDDHQWLLDHVVDGRPTVPATVILQIGAEAARHLAPDLLPVRFSNIVLSSFIRAPIHAWPRHLTVTATRAGDTVGVRIDSSPSGAVPVREHARMTVTLAANHRAVAPDCDARPVSGTAVTDVYQEGGSIHLAGVFSGVREARLHPDGGSSLFGFPARTTIFDRFVIPSVAIDALLRSSVLDGSRSGPPIAIVPTAIDEIEIHVQGNDADWDELCAGGIVLRHREPTGSCIAVAPDGTILASLRGISSVPRDTRQLVLSGPVAQRPEPSSTQPPRPWQSPMQGHKTKELDS